MRLPDFSDQLRPPTPGMNAEERGQRLLQYVAARQSLQGADFRTASLRVADLRGADLSGVQLVDANLFSADLRGARMVGVLLERATLQRARLSEADLRNARMSGARLESAQLISADLRFADLQRTQLYGANLQRADLQQASLCGANLQHARFRQADLRGADLRGADLRQAELLGTRLEGAHIDRAGVRRSGWSPGDLQEYQRLGLVLSEAPPPPRAPQSAAPAEDTPDVPDRQGLQLRWPTPPAALEAALLGVVVAAWQAAEEGRDAALSTVERPLLVTASDPDELEALALLMRDHRWSEIALEPLLQPAALTQLEALVASRSGFSLWIHKSDGLRPVLTW